MRRIGACVVFILLLLAAALAPAQQPYPARAVKIFVGFAPGGPADAVGRIVAERLSERFKQPFVVENRLGANGMIAIQALLNNPADGYTLMLATWGGVVKRVNVQQQ